MERKRGRTFTRAFPTRLQGVEGSPNEGMHPTGQKAAGG